MSELNLPQISQDIWNSKYRFKDDHNSGDQSVMESLQRTAQSMAQQERDSQTWAKEFLNVLKSFEFLPGGRILANAGTSHKATLFNCFVMGKIEDSMDGIFEALKEGALTMQYGGGVGYDFSSLRPKGNLAKTTNRVASGPVSFMHVWNTMCATVLNTSARRGAMMATLRCDHPDIREFIHAKANPKPLNHFNLSVLVTEKFMKAVQKQENWRLQFSEDGAPLASLSASELWHEIIESSYQTSEPGVLFIDRINQFNNLWYKENITCTNPCGEIPLPPYGACDLGSVNLTQFVENPFSPQAQFNFEKLKNNIPVYVRFLDNVIEASEFPLQVQKEAAHNTRRIGLGITGLADSLIMLNLHYGQEEARKLAQEVMRMICYEAYRASIQLAQEKGAFPDFERDAYLQGAFIKSLPSDIQEQIYQYGIRNSHLIAIAPTGTISILARNVSSGVEPVFSLHYTRRVLQKDGNYKKYDVYDYVAQLWQQLKGNQKYPQTFVTAHNLSPKEQLLMLAALQPYVDNSISKTINVPEEFSFEEFKNIYELAYQLGLKGCTTYRKSKDLSPILS